MGFGKLSTYGIMKDYSKETIKELISFLVADGYITLYGDQYPVLRLNKNALEVLRGNKKVTIKRVISKQNATVVNEKTFVDNGLFDILRAIRKKIADKQNVPPFVIFSDATLKDMCKKCPTSEEDMLMVSGVGAFKLENYGEQFMSAIKSYIGENKFEIDDQTPMKLKTAHVAKTAKPKIDTRLATYELYKDGLSIDEIATERGLSTNTIEGHLIDCLEKGMKVDSESFFPKELEPQILEAIKSFGTGKLKAIKEVLPEQITYGAIRFVIYKNKL